MTVINNQKHTRKRSFSNASETSAVLYHRIRPYSDILLQPALKKIKPAPFENLPQFEEKEFDHNAHFFVDNILAVDNSNLDHELKFIEKHKIPPRVSAEILLRKSVQNMPHKEWIAMDKEKKQEYVNQALDAILNVLDLDNNSLYKKLIKSDVKNNTPLEKLEADHLVAKKNIIVKRVREKEYYYLRRFSDSAIEAERYPTIKDFEQGFFPEKFPHIDRYEEWFKKARLELEIKPSSALSVVVDYPNIKGDCQELAYSFLLKRKIPESIFSGIQKIGLNKFEKSTKEIDFSISKSIVFYNDEANSLKKHYSVNIGNSFWLSKRGEIGASYLLAHPAVDVSDYYGKIESQILPKDNTMDLGVPLNEMSKYFGFPGKAISSLPIEEHSYTESQSTEEITTTSSVDSSIGSIDTPPNKPSRKKLDMLNSEIPEIISIVNLNNG